MEITTAAGFVPLLWTLVALVLVIAGGIVFAVDPELAEVYIGDPPWIIGGVAVVVLLVATLASRPDLTHGMTGLLLH
jgi:hypothetical protein